MKGKEDTLLHLAGVQEAPKVRTVGAAQALARLRVMNVLPKQDTGLDELIELRNGIAHLDADADESFDGLSVFVRATTALLRYLGKEREEYWDDWIGIIEITESDALEYVAKEVARRIEGARYHLSERLKYLPQKAVSVIYEHAEAGDPDVARHGLIARCGLYSLRSPKGCPACHCTGHLVFNLPNIGSGPLEGSDLRFFYCPLCSFTASGDDELAACGIGPNEIFLNGQGESIPLNSSMFKEYVDLGMADVEEVEAAVEFANQWARRTTA